MKSKVIYTDYEQKIGKLMIKIKLVKLLQAYQLFQLSSLKTSM